MQAYWWRRRLNNTKKIPVGITLILVMALTYLLKNYFQILHYTIQRLTSYPENIISTIGACVMLFIVYLMIKVIRKDSHRFDDFKKTW